MADKYRLTLKSEEQRGASQPNIVYVGAGSDADAIAFATNLEHGFVADVVSVDKILSQDYGLPYPAGTGVHARCAMWSADFFEAQMRLRELAPAVDVEALAASLIADGIRLPVGDYPLATAINIYVLKPQQSF